MPECSRVMYNFDIFQNLQLSRDNETVNWGAEGKNKLTGFWLETGAW